MSFAKYAQPHAPPEQSQYLVVVATPPEVGGRVTGGSVGDSTGGLVGEATGGFVGELVFPVPEHHVPPPHPTTHLSSLSLHHSPP